MAQSHPADPAPDLPEAPDTSHLITEDDTPVDSFYADKQLRLFGELGRVWRDPAGRPYLCATDVGMFPVAKNPAIVPDGLLAFDVDVSKLEGRDGIRSYFFWEFGKPPDLVFELVSKEEGGELDAKLRAYEKLRIAYYVVFDPLHTLSSTPLRLFAMMGSTLVEQPLMDSGARASFAPLQLGLRIWEGELEGMHGLWLRWCDLDGKLVPISSELAQRADEEGRRADDEAKRADDAAKRADALAAKLRALGVDPDA